MAAGRVPPAGKSFLDSAPPVPLYVFRRATGLTSHSLDGPRKVLAEKRHAPQCEGKNGKLIERAQTEKQFGGSEVTGLSVIFV
jgi:hypothetical protein